MAVPLLRMNVGAQQEHDYGDTASMFLCEKTVQRGVDVVPV
jgi:hypothetical protein